jgi:hypothetical protein
MHGAGAVFESYFDSFVIEKNSALCGAGRAHDGSGVLRRLAEVAEYLRF